MQTHRRGAWPSDTFLEGMMYELKGEASFLGKRLWLEKAPVSGKQHVE